MLEITSELMSCDLLLMKLQVKSSASAYKVILLLLTECIKCFTHTLVNCSLCETKRKLMLDKLALVFTKLNNIKIFFILWY